MRNRLADEVIEQMKQMRAAGASFDKIAIAMNVNYKTVYKYTSMVKKGTAHMTKRGELVARYDVGMLSWYKKRLKPGQRVKMMIYESPDGKKETEISGTVRKVYLHIAEIETSAPVWLQGVEVRKRKRIETIRIADLMLMNTGGEET